GGRGGQGRGGRGGERGRGEGRGGRGGGGDGRGRGGGGGGGYMPELGLMWSGFFPPSVCRLLEGLQKANECQGYIFEAHRRGVEGGRGTGSGSGLRSGGPGVAAGVKQLGEVERAADPDLEKRERIWALQSQQAEKEAKNKAKEKRQRQLEADRERKRKSRAREANERKAELEDRRMDRIYKKLEEKVVKEQAREKERLAKNLRRMFEGEITKRRTWAKVTLQVRGVQQMT
ncbi:unnamed protein product, partial [Discosporangium mesarthrocarpum]